LNWLIGSALLTAWVQTRLHAVVAQVSSLRHTE
jgi:hypothetical protein